MPREIVLFGTGIDAEKFVYEHGNEYDIKYVLELDKKIDKFLYKYDVFTPTMENCSRHFIIIACDFSRSKISPMLEKFGKREFIDFIWYEWENKKMVVLNGNCYGAQIKKYLASNNEFSKNFYFYPIPQIYENKLGTIDDYIMKNCSLFLHQDIRQDNKLGYKLSDDYLNKLLPKNAVSITIPNLVGFASCFFMQDKQPNPFNKPLPKTKYGLFPNGDIIIDKLCIEAFSTNQIVEKCINLIWFSKEDINAKLNYNIKKFKKREENWDIKILDYILDFFREKKVFYDSNHPANFVMRKICEEILKKLGIDTRLELLGNGINSYEMPIYPDISESLKLSWGDEIIRENSPYKLTANKMDMREYIKEYIFWCHQEKIRGTDRDKYDYAFD